MTDLKYSILGVLYSREPRQESTSNLIKLHFDTPAATDHAIEELIAANFIKPLLGSDKVEITPSGANAYEEASDVRQSQSEQKIQQRFDNKISVATVLVPLITFFLGIIVESQADIVGWLLSFFK
jgi:hypothetical protein